MPRARNGHVEIEYETFGEDGAPAILLLNGVAAPMTRWPAECCQRLVARGYRAIRMDNRDWGLSTWLGPDDVYSLRDMAQDAMAVLDASGVAQAHIVGVSLGGMIAQRAALDFPKRILSLTSIMSTPGLASAVSTPEAQEAFSKTAPDPETDFEGYVGFLMSQARVIQSPGYPWTDEALRERTIAEHRRAPQNFSGAARQRKAAALDGDRTADLGRLRIPTVVLHGAEDPLVPPLGGEATAAAIPGADLRIIPGMGHGMPAALHGLIVDAIVSAAERAGR